MSVTHINPPPPSSPLLVIVALSLTNVCELAIFKSRSRSTQCTCCERLLVLSSSLNVIPATVAKLAPGNNSPHVIPRNKPSREHITIPPRVCTRTPLGDIEHILPPVPKNGVDTLKMDDIPIQHLSSGRAEESELWCIALNRLVELR